MQATLLAALSAVVIDTLFYASARNSAAHFRIVQQRFASLTLYQSRQGSRIDCGSVPIENDDNNLGIFAVFRKLIGYHGRIIQLAARLSNVYEPPNGLIQSVWKMHPCNAAVVFTTQRPNSN